MRKRETGSRRRVERPKQHRQPGKGKRRPRHPSPTRQSTPEVPRTADAARTAPAGRDRWKGVWRGTRWRWCPRWRGQAAAILSVQAPERGGQRRRGRGGTAVLPDLVPPLSTQTRRQRRIARAVCRFTGRRASVRHTPVPPFLPAAGATPSWMWSMEKTEGCEV
jgi:hypothetical protein